MDHRKIGLESSEMICHRIRPCRGVIVLVKMVTNFLLWLNADYFLDH